MFTLIKETIRAITLIAIFGTCSVYSSVLTLDHDTLPAKKHYPSSVALKAFTNLAAVIPLDDAEGCSMHRDLLNLNQHIVHILTGSGEDESLCTAFQDRLTKILMTFRRIRSENILGKRTQEIAAAIEPNLNALSAKLGRVETYTALKSIIVGDMPEIAAIEFLERNKGIKEGSVRCEKCSHGYMTPKKNFGGNTRLECKLCNHHQDSPTKVDVRIVY